MNNIQSTSATVGIMTRKVIEAAGCRFTEHRGEGMPVRGNPLAKPGDSEGMSIYSMGMSNRFRVEPVDVHGRQQWLQTPRAGSNSLPISAMSCMGTNIQLQWLPLPDESKVGEADRCCRHPY